MNQGVFDLAERICPQHVGQLRADVVRYEILHRFGGVWADADFELLRPFDQLIEGAGLFAAWEIQDRWLANGLMGSVPGHPFVGRLIERLPESVRRHAGFKPNRMTGPQFLTREFRRAKPDLRGLPQRLFFPYGWKEAERFGPGDRWPQDAVAVHHWANKRRERGIPVAA